MKTRRHVISFVIGLCFGGVGYYLLSYLFSVYEEWQSSPTRVVIEIPYIEPSVWEKEEVKNYGDILDKDAYYLKAYDQTSNTHIVFYPPLPCPRLKDAAIFRCSFDSLPEHNIEIYLGRSRTGLPLVRLRPSDVGRISVRRGEKSVALQGGLYATSIQDENDIVYHSYVIPAISLSSDKQ